jgi:hypothetical protein
MCLSQTSRLAVLVPATALLMSACGPASMSIDSPTDGGFADISGSAEAVITITGGICQGTFSATLDGLDATSRFVADPSGTAMRATLSGLSTGNHLLVARVNAGGNCQAFKDKAMFFHAGSSGIYLTDGSNAQDQNDRIVQIADMNGAGWNTFGGPGSGTGQFRFPRGIAAYHINRIYVADQSNNRVVEIRGMTGAGFTAFGSQGVGVGRFLTPMGLAVDGTGRLYVTNSGSNQIVRFDDMTGAGWVAFGSTGSGVNQFQGPTSIALEPVNGIYIIDSGNSRIVRINDMTGAGWSTLGAAGAGPGQFGAASAIAVDRSGRLYIADTGNCRIVRVDGMNGAGWTTFGSDGSGVGQFNCTSGQILGIQVDGAGQIYVADQGNSRLVRFDDMTGDGWVTFGSYGRGTNQFVGPNGVFIKPPVMAIAP